MADKILAKNKMDAFVAGLAAGAEVYAPVDKGGETAWARVESAGEMAGDFVNTRMSPKDFFFPQTECMMRFKNVKDDPKGMILESLPGLAKERVILNMRPCDAKAFQVLDLIFIQDDMTNDFYWRDKREKTTIIALACNNPCPTCFCTSVNCGPHHEVGADVLLVDLGDKFLVRSLTDKGAKTLNGLDGLEDAGAGDADKAAQLKKAAEDSMQSKVGLDKVNAAELMDLYKHPYWDRVFETCLNCGTCTFCCPTCHCFDIQDEVKGGDGRRVRNWDYCMSWLFTEHGTGHNPRGTKKDRVRQRFMHKFKYIPMKRGGEIGCVGCGRCTQLCPVNIDVREVVNSINS